MTLKKKKFKKLVQAFLHKDLKNKFKTDLIIHQIPYLYITNIF